MNIPLSKAFINERMKKHVIKVLESGRYVKGPEVKKFEEEFAKYCKVKYGTAVSNGTMAIYIALRALGIKKGDEVIVPGNSFIASATPILLVGAKPVFADVDETYTIDPKDLENKITSRTKAVIAVHLYGQPCDMDRIMRLKKKYKFYLIEDCAQAHGAEYKGKKVGSFGEIGCFSFYPSKNMTVAGDGGMCITSNKKLDRAMKMLRDHGRDFSKPEGKYTHEILGFNFRMSEISATVGREQLKLLNRFIEKRRKIAKKYDKGLTSKITKPFVAKGRKHVYHLYVIRTEEANRDRLIEYLKKNGIAPDVHYRLPIHLQPIFKEYKTKLKNVEKFSKQIISLPIYPLLKNKEQQYIIKKINRFFGE